MSLLNRCCPTYKPALATQTDTQQDAEATTATEAAERHESQRESGRF